MRRKGRKTISYQKSIILGFVVLYVTCMLFSTYLVKKNYAANYKESLTNKIMSLREAIYNPYFTKFNEDGSLNENYIQEINHALSAGLDTGDKYNQFYMALYGPDETIVAQTTEFFGQTRFVQDEENASPMQPDAMALHSPYSYFTDEEMEKILFYLEQAYEEKRSKNGLRTDYELLIKYNRYTGEPLWVEISEQTEAVETKLNENGVENVFIETLGDSKMLWRWINPNMKNPNFELYESGNTNSMYSSMTTEFSFPYLSSGRKYYDTWKHDEILQTFDVKDAIHNKQDRYTSVTIQRDRNHISVIYPMQLEEEAMISSHENIFYMTDSQANFALQINQASYPWLAAVDYMKYVYIFGALLMLVCMLKVLYTTKKTYEKQEELEQTRRDFTNAAAHELKTPLAIVRGLAETMEETPSEEKKSFYRMQIIEQTEIMDRLVKEMIFISKMDQEDLKLKQEEVSVLSIIEEQLDKLETLTQEKNLKVEYQKEEDWVILGDKTYLEKAFFSILENAVAYNKPDGKIAIQISKESCAIENTADPIPEENLPHLCDLFFTSNKSRKSDVGHKGLGLYLAKRIFDMHKMGMRIENSEVGVKVSIF